MKITWINLFAKYWIHWLFLFFAVNYLITRQIQLSLYAQSCMTTSAVASDNRCLYIYGTNVYEKGSRGNPHKGNACGTDVTSKIPHSHTSNAAKFLDPNLVGSLCQMTAPTATPRPTSTPQPTATPIPPTRVPTATIKPATGASPIVPNTTSSVQPTATRVPAPSNTIKIQLSPTVTPATVNPQTVQTTPAQLVGFGSNAKPPDQVFVWKSAELIARAARSPSWPLVSQWSAALVVVSFIIMLCATAIGIGKKFL